jgi:hypothetical protein
MEGDKLVATGTWFYGGVTPMRIEIYARPARFAPSRFDDDDDLDESRPIPQTDDGYVYVAEGVDWARTLEEAKANADSSPWGPVTWD